MRAEDKAAFGALLRDAMAFYKQDVSRFALGVWWQACQGFDLEQVTKALTQHAMDAERGQFAPKPADIVRQLQGTQADRSLMAWGKVMEAMQSVGAYRSVCFDDPAIHNALEDMGGWVKVCRSTYDDLPHVQKRFCDIHRAYSAPGRKSEHAAYLLGASEIENTANKAKVSPPFLIGDEARAMAVYSSGVTGGVKRVAINMLPMSQLAVRSIPK